MGLEPITLAEQQKLCEGHTTYLIRQFVSEAIDRRRIALDQLCGPLEVIRVVEPGFERTEERVVFQPVGLIIAELLIGRPQIGASAGAEVGPGLLEQSVFERNDGVVIDLGWGERARLAIAPF